MKRCVLIVLVSLLVVGCGGSSVSERESLKELFPGVLPVDVGYFVEGMTDTANIAVVPPTWVVGKEFGEPVVTKLTMAHVAVPLRTIDEYLPESKQLEEGLHFKMNPGSVVYIWAQASDPGHITCRIEIDGVEIVSDTDESLGKPRVVTCEGRA